MLHRRLNGLTICGRWTDSSVRTALAIERRVPRRIGGIGDEVLIVVRRAVGPPRWSSFAQCDLGGVDGLTGLGERSAALGAMRFHGATGAHQFVDECLAVVRVERWIGRSPQALAHDEITTVLRDRI